MKPNVCNSLRSHAYALAPLAGLSFLCLASTPAECATSITNSLTGYTGNSEEGGGSNQPPFLDGSGLNVSFVWPGGDASWEKIDFSTSGAIFGTYQAGSNGRNYLRTNGSNYSTASGFSAYVTVNRPTRQSVFFGIGNGTLGNNKTPDDGTGNASAFLELQEGHDNASRRRLGGIPGTPTNEEAGWNPMSFVTGQMRLRMDYDSSANTVTYSIDYNPSGAFVADQSFDVVDVSSIAPEWTAGENSSIYFGGQGGVTFTDFQLTVIPEPSAALLLLGVGSLGIRRRR